MIRFDVEPEPIVDDADAVRAALLAANPRILLATVAQVTRDLSVLVEMEPDPLRLREPDAGYSPEQITHAADVATKALLGGRGSSDAADRPLSGTDVRRLIDYIAGYQVDDDYAAMVSEEMALDGQDLRAPTWRLDDIAPGRDFRVGVIGAGMSGIAVAHRLNQAGVDVTIFEKSSGVGGTWHDNRYPGCRVDVPSIFYSYSFAQTIDWPEPFSQQEVLNEYFHTCVDNFGLADLIEFETEVTESRWDDVLQQWSVTLRRADGETAVTRVDALVSATGQLSRPQLPNIVGREDFVGPAFHSAQWQIGIELAGKRVGVIGTGASAIQLVPRVAEVAEHVTVFQRRPPWLLDVWNYQQPIPEALRWLKRHLPTYQAWERAGWVLRQDDTLLPLTEVDPSWDHPGSVSEPNDLLRQMLLPYYDDRFADEALRSKVIPEYAPAAKRALLDDGTYAAALHRDNVRLETEAIGRIVGDGIDTVDGGHHQCDVLIYATGFAASGFLMPMQVYGSGGVSLHERWGGDARAYNGVTIPEMPNLFLMYGPNTNIVVNGSIIFFSECETTYIVDAIRALLEDDLSSLACRVDVHDDYNDEIDAANKLRVWGASDVESWYKNDFGRSAANWPHTLIRYWRQTRSVDLGDYVTVPR